MPWSLQNRLQHVYVWESVCVSKSQSLLCCYSWDRGFSWNSKFKTRIMTSREILWTSLLWISCTLHYYSSARHLENTTLSTVHFFKLCNTHFNLSCSLIRLLIKFLVVPNVSIAAEFQSRLKEHSSGFCYLTINSHFMENEEEQEARFGSWVKLLDCTASFWQWNYSVIRKKPGAGCAFDNVYIQSGSLFERTVTVSTCV